MRRRPFEGRPGLYVDNFEANPGTGGDTFAADDVGGVKIPRSKIVIGDDGSNDGDVSAANPLPVTGTLAVTHSALTELGGAINASAQMDVNLAASGVTVPVSNAGLTELAAVVFVDDAAFTAATSSVAAVGGIVTSDSVDSGDVGAFAMLANRQQKVTLYDSSGVELAVGGGTQYTEDAAAAANPVGNAMIVVRDDNRAGSLTNTDGDNVALRGNNNGELYVKHTDSVAITHAALTELAGAIDTEVQVDVVSSTLPSGAATSAKQDTIIGHVDGVETLLGGGLPAALGAQGALKIEGVASGTAVPVSVATIPSHAVTNAGVFAVQVDGSALTALQLIDDAVYAEDVAAQAADKGLSILAVRRDADTTLVDTTGDYANLQVDANGALKVEIFDGGGSHTVDNNGTFVVQVDGSALTALQLIDDPVVQDDVGFTPGTTKVMMVGFEADEGSTDSVDEGDGGAARMTLDRKQITTPQPHTAGGLSISRDIDLDNSTLTVVKNSPGQLYGMHIANLGTVTAFVKFYDATSGTLGTGTPVMTVPIPGNASDDTLFSAMYPYGVTFATGICVGAGTGVADNDTGDPGANIVVANIFYK